MHTSVPLDVPLYPAYTIVGESDISTHLAKILKLIHPTSDTSTCESVGDAHDLGHLVLCGSNWAADRDTLLGAGHAPNTFSVLTVPIGDPWAYWEFSESNIDKMKFESGVRMDVMDFEQYLLHDVRTAQLDEDGRFRLNENRYAYFDQAIIERNSTTIKKVADRLSNERSQQAYLKVLMSRPKKRKKIRF